MLIAIEQAKIAYSKQEVPVGAVIYKNNEIISSSHNLVITNADPTAHAEILAVKQASKALKTEFLTDCTIYITLEPCPMCAYAISLARISKIVFGAYDLKRGAISTNSNIFNKSASFYKPEIIGGILEDECSELLKEFFRQLR